MSLDIEWKDDPERAGCKFLNNETSPLKEMMVSYVGEKLSPKNDDVTIDMIVEVMAEEFPELTLLLAEENWVRGYKQAFQDLRDESK